MKLSALTKFLDRLDEADMHYTLTSERENAIMVGVTVPGQRWEIEFDSDGEIEVEIFKSNGEIHDEEMLEELFELNEDD
jgi:hypothetical protein